MMGMVLLFAMLETTAKSLSESYPVPLIVWFRYITHFILMVVLLGPRYGSRLIRTEQLKAQIIRALLLLGSTALYFSALSQLPLATAKSISFISPLLVTIFAFFFLKENVSRAIWIAVFVGLLGVLLVINPSKDFNWFFLIPLLSAISYSLYQIMTRHFSAREHPVTTLFYSGLVGSILMSAVVPFFWVTPILVDVPKFIFLGLAGAFGHYMLIKAMELEDASFLSPLGYTQLVWATFFGVGFTLAALMIDENGSLGRVYLAHAALAASLWGLLALMLPRGFAPPTRRWPSLSDHLAIYQTPRLFAPALGHGIYAALFLALVTYLPAALNAPWLAPVLPLAGLGGSLLAGILGRIFLPSQLVWGGFLAMALLFFTVSFMASAAPAVAILAMAVSGMVAGGGFAAVPWLNTSPEDRALSNGALAQLGNIGTFSGTPILAALGASQAVPMAVIGGLIGAVLTLWAYRAALR